MTAWEAQCIISVARNKSISRAAKEVFVTQQTLSKIVERVEKEIGARLFNRLTSGVEVSDIGSHVIPVIISLEESYKTHIKIINDIIKKEDKDITISFEHKFLSTLIPEELLTNFNILGIRTDVAHTIEKCVDDVTSGRYSLGVCHKRESFGSLRYVPIVDEAAHVLMRKDHFLSGKKELTLSDLKGVPLFEMLPEGTPQEIFVSASLKEGFYPNYVSKIDDISMMIRNIRSGVGVAIGSRFYLPDGHEDILYIPLKHELITMAVGFILRPDTSPEVCSFIKAVTNYYSR
jgi:DNA-binding transcriptional LysR family regulator